MSNDLWLKIMADMEQRRAKGWETYGKPLTADDGRNWFREVKEELLDSVAYATAGEELLDYLQVRLTESEQALAVAKDRIRELEANK